MADTSIGPGEVPRTTVEQLLLRINGLDVSFEEVRETLAKKQEESSQPAQPTTTTHDQAQVQVEGRAQAQDEAQAPTPVQADSQLIVELTEKLGRVQERVQAFRECVLQIFGPTLDQESQAQASAEQDAHGDQENNSDELNSNRLATDMDMMSAKLEEMVKVVQNAIPSLVALLDGHNTRDGLENKDDLAEFIGLLDALNAEGAVEDEGADGDAAGGA
ncbi:hypothetical protein BGX23_004941 [Mortierella sp. AD031]|nr:hypothetical protein BGX23_004941 [Mortierella sp. AD031]